MITKLGDDEVKFNLALSLHAANDQKRNEIMAKMQEKNIPTALYYPAALHLQKPYFDSDAHLPITEHIADRVISLPMHPYLEKGEIEYISDNLINILDGLN